MLPVGTPVERLPGLEQTESVPFSCKYFYDTAGAEIFNVPVK